MKNANKNTTQLYPKIYRNKASTSPKINTTSDLVQWDENREHFVCNAKNNKNIPIWTWLRGAEQCAFPTAKSQHGAAHANDPCQRLPQSASFPGVLGFCL